VSLLPEGKKDLPQHPKKADWVALVKKLLGGEGAPQLSVLVQELASKQLATGVVMTVVAVDATDVEETGALSRLDGAQP